MTSDAKFEDGAEKPLHLKAMDTDDLSVVAALLQDAVLPMDQITWDKTGRRFALLVNRFRWERETTAAPERVQSVFVVDDVMRVSSQGIDRQAPEMVTSLLSVAFTASKDGCGTLNIVMSGDGAIALDVETLEVTLKDVTRPYEAPSGRRPDHGA